MTPLLSALAPILAPLAVGLFWYGMFKWPWIKKKKKKVEKDLYNPQKDFV